MMKVDGDFKKDTWPKADLSIENSLTLLEAESDKNVEEMIKNYDHLSVELCKELENLINIAKVAINDEFITINDHRNHEVLLYLKEHKVFIPHCEGNYEIKLINISNICFKEIPILWEKHVVKADLSNELITENGTGFLTKNKIIITESSRTSCDESIIEIELKEHTLKSIKSKNGQISYLTIFRSSIIITLTIMCIIKLISKCYLCLKTKKQKRSNFIKEFLTNERRVNRASKFRRH